MIRNCDIKMGHRITIAFFGWVLISGFCSLTIFFFLFDRISAQAAVMEAKLEGMEQTFLSPLAIINIGSNSILPHWLQLLQHHQDSLSRIYQQHNPKIGSSNLIMGSTLWWDPHDPSIFVLFSSFNFFFQLFLMPFYPHEFFLSSHAFCKHVKINMLRVFFP